MDSKMCVFCFNEDGVLLIYGCHHFCCFACAQEAARETKVCPICFPPAPLPVETRKACTFELAKPGSCPHGDDCPLSHGPGLKADLPKRGPLPCIFEQKGPGKCPHGASCPRSHDPSLLMAFWNPPPRPPPPVERPVLPLGDRLATDPGPPQKQSGGKFVYNSVFAEDETKRTEFKACAPQNFETQVAVHMLAKYICAFLNTMGGVLYYGITDDHVVKGLILSAQQRDKLRLAIDQCCNSFHPEVDTDKVGVKFEKVWFRDGGEKANASVVVIKVQKGDAGIIYFTPDHKAWSKRQASIRELKSTSLVAFIKKKLQGGCDDEDSSDDEEESKDSKRLIPERKWPVWDYYCTTRMMWIEYPEEVQSQLEQAFISRQPNISLMFRGEQSLLDFSWMREVKGFVYYETRRLDWRAINHGVWWTLFNDNWLKFDLHTCEALDHEFLNERPDSEVSIDDFIYEVSFERMRLTGETPIWRTIE